MFQVRVQPDPEYKDIRLFRRSQWMSIHQVRVRGLEKKWKKYRVWGVCDVMSLMDQLNTRLDLIQYLIKMNCSDRIPAPIALTTQTWKYRHEHMTQDTCSLFNSNPSFDTVVMKSRD